LARHCTDAGLIEKAADFWGRAGQRSLARSALVEASEQLTRALDQIATLSATPTLRREQIKLQVALVNTLMHVKGYAAPETKAAIEQAGLYIERAKALAEPPEDPLLLFSVLYGLWTASYVAFNGDAVRAHAAQFLTLAEKQGSADLLMIGHRLMANSLAHTGDVAESRAHYDRAMSLYDPAGHRPLATRFAVDSGVATLSYRSMALWVLGYPEAALADTKHAMKDAREIGQAATLMYALVYAQRTHANCGCYATAIALADELVRLADEKSAPFWKGAGTVAQGYLSLTGDAAVQMITSGMAQVRATGGRVSVPMYLSFLAKVYADSGRFDDAWRCVSEAMTTMQITKETLFEAEASRMAGEIALKSAQRDVAKAEGYFERALAVARKQLAKSFELRAAMSMERLWRDQGKVQQARELLAPVYGWFTEGFDTRDLKEAKALLEELASQGTRNHKKAPQMS
jgi:predicted ATPase